jgi:hypothetical protein
MNNIRVVKTDIDISKIQAQLKKHPGDWGSQKGLDNVELKDPHQ